MNEQQEMILKDFPFRIEKRSGEAGESLVVEGRACTFDSETVLYGDDVYEAREVIDPGAFAACDMTDVIFNYNHGGRVYARTRNGTLSLNVREDGLYMQARLRASDPGHKELYEDIEAGNIDRMSFAFTVDEDSWDYRKEGGKETDLRRIRSIRKLYDVSAVDIPAYDTTNISARRAFEEARKRRMGTDMTITQAEGENMKEKEMEAFRESLENMDLREVNALAADLEKEERSGEGKEGNEEKLQAIRERRSDLEALEKRKQAAEDLTSGKAVPDRILETRREIPKVSPLEKRADEFTRTGRMELRQLLSTGVLTPTAVKESIGELPTVISSIVDDVTAIDVEGNGSYAFSYRISDSEAADVTEGEVITGTPGAFKKDGMINPTTWGILDEVSNQVSQKTPIAYMASIQSNAYLALRRVAKVKLTNAIVNSTLATPVAYALDEHYIRNLVLGYDSDESVEAGKLYLCKEDLATLGKIRGTNEKKPVFDIEYTDANNGRIKDGGLSVPFCLNATLKGIKSSANVQLYGDPKSVTMCLWGPYEVATDQGGDYFKRNMIGIRGLQTAGADLTRKGGMQIVSNTVG